MAAIAVALFAAALAPAAAAAALSPEQRAAVDEALAREIERSGYPGMVAGIWSPEGAYTTAAGVSDIATGAPASVEQPFRIGSVTKTFTATIVLGLVERGELRLADRLSEFFPRVPQASRIRVRDLLDHTSGVPDLPAGVSARVVLRPQTAWRPGELIRRASLEPSECAVDECYHYSNVNYVLLGRIAEQVTGRSIETLLERRIIRPLGLRDTGLAASDEVPPGIAHGYLAVAPDPPEDTTTWNFSWSWSAGAMVSTLADLHRYARALATGRGLLSRATQRRRTRFVPLRFTGRQYRYGLGIAKFGTYLGHNGVVPGYEAMVLHSPQRRTTLIVLGNTSVELDDFGTGTPPDPDLFSLARTLRDVLADRLPPRARASA